MPRERFDDPFTEGRYTQVSWRRRPGLDSDDQGTAPGHVQLSVHDETVDGTVKELIGLASALMYGLAFPDSRPEGREISSDWSAAAREWLDSAQGHKPEMESIHSQFDETGIDRLIRTLHKAKRQALGSQAVISSGTPGECSDSAPRFATGGYIPGSGADTDRIPAELSEGTCDLVIRVDSHTDPDAIAAMLREAQALAQNPPPGR